MSVTQDQPVAVCSRSFSKSEFLRTELLKKFPKAFFNDTDRVLQGPELAQFIGAAPAAISGLEKIDAALLTECKNLKVLAKYGVGLDMLDASALEAAQVNLGWTPGVNKRSVAELTLFFAIGLFRLAQINMRECEGMGFKAYRGQEMTGKTIGVLGTGNVGQDFIRLLQPFGCKILGHDLRSDEPEMKAFYEKHQVRAVDLEELVASVDLLSVHVPLDPTTRGLVSADKIQTMKKGSRLINTARGGIVDEDAVLSALETGGLVGAAFDVFATEPPDDWRLVQHPRFMGTPHIGGSTEECVLEMGLAAIRGLEKNQPIAAWRNQGIVF